MMYVLKQLKRQLKRKFGMLGMVQAVLQPLALLSSGGTWQQTTPGEDGGKAQGETIVCFGNVVSCL